MKIKFAQTCVIALSLYATTAAAANWEGASAAEIAVLPPYCTVRVTGGMDKNWLNTLGSIYNHLHHYCYALNYANRYYKSPNSQDRKFYLLSIDNNVNYVITHGDQSSTLMPEIYFTKGKFLILGGKDAEGVKAFFQAIQLKPDYPDPYVGIADFYTQRGNNKDALKFLQDGLRQQPTSRQLARRYKELGGKLPLPEVPASNNKSASTESQTPVPAETEKKVVVAAPLVVPQTSNPGKTPAGETTPEKIGNPSNPWCRFCAEDALTPAGK
jgi:tetratricopeptide (TPR) repeat protein